MTTRAPTQRLKALGAANRVRVARARLKVETRHDPTLAADVLREPLPAVLGMRAHELLRAIPRVGRGIATLWLVDAGVPLYQASSITIGQLRAAQREQIARLIDEREARRRSA